MTFKRLFINHGRVRATLELYVTSAGLHIHMFYVCVCMYMSVCWYCFRYVRLLLQVRRDFVGLFLYV